MSDYSPLIAAAEQKYGLPSGLLGAVIAQESGGNPAAVSKKGAGGLGQLMPGTASDMGVTNPLDPAQNIDGSARYLSKMLAATGGNVPNALRAYNGGTDPRNWNNPETQAYPGKVLARMPASIGDMGLSDPAPAAPTPAPSVADMGFSDPTPAAPPAQGAAAAASVGGDAQADELTKAQADVKAMAGPAAASPADVVKDPETGQTAPAVSPDSNEPFLGWGTANGQRYPMYGNPGKPSDSIPENLKQGADMGLQDFKGTIGQGAQWLENKVPGLRSLDQSVGNLTGGQTADQIVAQYNREKAIYGLNAGTTGAGKIGRVGGQLALAVPATIATGGALGAGLDAVGAGGAADFMGVTPAARLAAEAEARTAAAAAGTPLEQAGTNLLQRSASRAASGAFQGATGAALLSGQSDAPLGTQMRNGAIGGSLLGAGVGAAGDAVGALTNKLIPAVDPATAQAAQNASDMGINLRGSQITGSPLIRRLDAQMETHPGTGFAEQNAAQRSAFTRAVGNTFGADADALTPTVMSAARDKIGSVYNDVAGRTNLDLNPENGSPFLNNVAQVVSDAHGVLDTTKIPALNNLVDNVLSKVGPDGTMSGTAFKAMTAKGSMLDKATKDSNPSFSGAAKAIKAELNSALESSATPEDVQALRNADWQWKNMKTVEPLVAKSPDGTISPALLNAPVTRSFSNRAYTGAGDLGDLSDIGQRFLKQPSSSGTAENIRAGKMLDGAGTAMAVAGGLGAHALGGSVPVDLGVAGLIAGMGTARAGGNWLLSKALSSDALRNRLLSAVNPVADAAPGIIAQSAPALGGNKLAQALQALNDNGPTALRKVAASPNVGSQNNKNRRGN